MNNPSRRLAMLLAAVLTACGGGGSGDSGTAAVNPPAAPPPTALSASVGNCEIPADRVHDSGTVLYVVAPSTCLLAFPTTVKLHYRARDSHELVRTVDVPLAAADDVNRSELPELGVRDISLFQQGRWRSLPNTNSWTPRDGAGALVLGGKLYLLGGWLYGPVTNEVWVTSDLKTWKLLGNAPWQARHGSGWVVHDNRLWVIGGDLIADAWSSADGVVWRLEALQAPFGKRYTPNVVSHDGSLYLYGGQYWEPVDWCISRPDCRPVGLNDVWKSTDGRNWVQVNPNAPWSGRGLIHGGMVWNGEMYLLGGGLKGSQPNEPFNDTMMEFRDIWSSKDGVEWQLRSLSFSFPGRTHFSVLSTPLGCFVSDGSVGSQFNVSNDVYFAPDCVNYTALPDPPLQRRHASSLTYFNGSIVIMGGAPTDNPGTEIWQYFP
jgi:hypothetical protein